MFEEFKYFAEDHTLISYDLRNRGQSDGISDPSKLEGGVENDVDDLEAIRSYFNAERISVLGHSYVGMVVALYAMRFAPHVNRAVLIGPTQPFPQKQYPAHLTGSDDTMAEVSAKMAELQKQAVGSDPKEFGRRMWALMRQLYVTDPADAEKITWSVEHLPNESLFNVMNYFNQHLFPSIQRVSLSEKDFSIAQMPVLVIHGTRDRQASYGGGREWAVRLPNARLLTIENAAHLPWIESPASVFTSTKVFLNGEWPRLAEQVTFV